MSDDKATKSWGCTKCRGESFEEGDAFRNTRNCDSESSQNIAWDWMPSLRRCPWSQVDPASLEVFRWYTDWKSFEMLPWHGTMLEQPAFVVEAIRFCEYTRLEIEATERDKSEREADRARAKSKRGGSR